MQLRYLVIFIALVGIGSHALFSAVYTVRSAVHHLTTDTSVVRPSEQLGSSVQTSDSSNTYLQMLHSIEQRIQSYDKLARRDSGDWIMRDRLARALLEKATLTGRSADFLPIRGVLAEAFANAPKGSGPLLTAARFHYAIHELVEADQHLATLSKQFLQTQDTATAAAILRANIDLQRGNYNNAETFYRRCETEAPGVCRVELALFQAQIGNYAEAEALLNASLEKTEANDAHSRSWLLLQMGILSMQQGKYEQALSRLNRADQAMPGWWLVREHIAEVTMLQGKIPEAIALYTEVVRETNLPQFMDALAEAYAALGRTHDAQQMLARAEKRWEEELTILPNSGSSHALEHFLEHAKDEARLVELAERNATLRPSGEHRTLLVNAYLKAGNLDAATSELTSLLATPYVSAELYDTASQVYVALGDEARSREFRAKTLAINPNYR